MENEYLRIKNHYFHIRPGRITVVAPGCVFLVVKMNILPGTEVFFIKQAEFEDQFSNQVINFLK